MKDTKKNKKVISKKEKQKRGRKPNKIEEKKEVNGEKRKARQKNPMQNQLFYNANQPVVEMVRWTVVSPTHQGSNLGARIISGFILGFPGFILGFPAMRFQWEETFPLMTRRLR